MSLKWQMILLVLALGSWVEAAFGQSYATRDNTAAARALAQLRSAEIGPMKKAVRRFVSQQNRVNPAGKVQMDPIMEKLQTLDFTTDDNYGWLYSWALIAGWQPKAATTNTAAVAPSPGYAQTSMIASPRRTIPAPRTTEVLVGPSGPKGAWRTESRSLDPKDDLQQSWRDEYRLRRIRANTGRTAPVMAGPTSPQGRWLLIEPAK